MKRNGVKKEFIVADFLYADEFLKGPTNRKPKEGTRYFYYTGPNDEKTRDFCKYILKLDKVFSEEEIKFMSDMLGYSVLRYKGSYNCRHEWVQFNGKRIKTPAPTVSQIDRLIEKNINYGG